MPMAIGDPEEIFAFANVLEHYIKAIDDETGKLRSSFDHLSNTWRDEKQASFEQTLDQLMGVFNSFKQNANEQIPYLRTMAERLKTYLGT